MVCPRCNDSTHLDFPTGREACNGCDRTPTWCRCQPVRTERVPAWIERQRAHRLPAKELVA